MRRDLRALPNLELMVGQSVPYVVDKYRSRVPEERVRSVELLDDSVAYDKTRYTDHLMRGIGTLLEPFGIDEQRLVRLVRSVSEAKQESFLSVRGNYVPRRQSRLFTFDKSGWVLNECHGRVLAE